MPAVSANISFNRVYSTTAAAERSTVAMEIIQSNPLLWHLYRQGAVMYEGGTECRVPVVLTQSQNIGAISTYETFSTTPEDGPDKARFHTWYKNRASMVIDNTELAQNRGKYQIVNLLQSKMAISKISMVNDLSRQLYADNAATPKEINGLDSMLEFAPPGAAQVKTVGGIVKADYANWQNQYGQITAFGTDGLDVWEEVYMDCSKKGTHPDIILTDPAVYRFFKLLVAPNQEERDKAMWDQGFENLLFNGTPVVPDDELALTGKTYFLTTTGKRGVSDFNLKPEYFEVPGKNPLVQGKGIGVGLQLAILSSDDFRQTEFLTPPNSDVILSHTYMTCMLTTSSMTRQGCVDFAGAIQF
ncbi:MAG TPA: phage major capsid protein [Myxococcales bacterium]|nr:phage major capsid protein [Myxococcales bacterium]